jgi:O-antigen ligase
VPRPDATVLPDDSGAGTLDWVSSREDDVRHERQWFDSTQLLILTSWAYVVVPRLVQTMTASKYRTSVSDSIPVSQLSLMSTRILGLALLGLALTIIVQRARDLPSNLGLALILMLAPWVFMISRDYYLGTRPRIETLLYPAVILAVWALRPRLDRLALLGWLTGLTALIGVLLGVFLPSKGIFTSVEGSLIAPEKQILPWGVLVGPFSDGNNYGQFLTLGLPAVALIRNRNSRVLLAVLITFTVLWTSSRSSLTAIVVGGLVFAVLGVSNPVTRRTLARVMVVVTAVVMVALPLVTTRDDAFTNRGYIWRISLDIWQRDPWFGYGSSWYSQIGQYVNSLPSSAYHGHNQFVQTLVVGGVVYLLLTGAMFVVLVYFAGNWALHNVAYPAVFMAMFHVSATMEVSFGVVDRSFLIAVTWLPMAFFVFAERGPSLPTVKVSRARTGSRSAPVPTG